MNFPVAEVSTGTRSQRKVKLPNTVEEKSEVHGSMAEKIAQQR